MKGFEGACLVDDRPSMIPLDTIHNNRSDQVVQLLAPAQFIGTTSGPDTTCPNDSLDTNPRPLGIFDDANGDLEIGRLTQEKLILGKEVVPQGFSR